MGCNCKVNKQILKIHKNYGNKINIPWSQKLHFKIVESLKIIIISGIVLLLLPFILLIIIFLMIIGKRNFNINKLIKKILVTN